MREKFGNEVELFPPCLNIELRPFWILCFFFACLNGMKS